MSGNLMMIIMNVAGMLACIGVSIPFFLPPATLVDHTAVELVLGRNSSVSGGNAPDITLFNNQGEPTARWTDEWSSIATGGSYNAVIKHGNELDSIHGCRWWPPKYERQASYVLLSMGGGRNDGICISAVSVSDNNFDSMISGDMLFKCGALWAYGDNPIGGVNKETHYSKCFWIDADNGDDSARAVSLHLPSFIGTYSKMYQYSNNSDTLCKSTPRLAWWTHLEPHSWIPFFKPPLEFEIDNDSGEATGKDKDLTRVLDQPGQYDRNVLRYMPEGLKDPYKDSYEEDEIINGKPCKANSIPCKRHHRRSLWRRSSLTDHLVVSEHESHSAKVLCESPSSRMEDFVSLKERLFCDMVTKTLYPLCGDKTWQEGLACFDLENEVLLHAAGRSQDSGIGPQLIRKGPAKVYKSTKYWSPA